MIDEVYLPVHRGRCVKCNAIRNLVSLDEENWCLNCLLEREKILKARSEVDGNALYELEGVRGALWILERERKEANYV